MNVYPSLVEEIVRAFPDISEYRVQLDCRKSMADLSVEIEAVADCQNRDALPPSLEESLQNALHLRIPVRLLPGGSLPRFEMKARRWIRLTE